MVTSKSKIFGIGLSKTGTTSLANALQILGYCTKDNMGVVKYAAGDLSSIDLDVIDANDAFTDTPIPSFYLELDARFPRSKFILTIRDRDGWLKSCMKQFNQRFAQGQSAAQKQLFLDIYGTNVFDEKQFADGYERFVDGVRKHFKERQGDLLIMNVSAGDGWEKLCPFLGQPVPDVPFPRANVTRVRWMIIDEVVAVARHAGLELIRRYDSARHTSVVGSGGERGHAGYARKLLERAVQTVRGEEPVEAAVRRARKAIAAGLKKLTPEIPVVSRTADDVAHAERRHWNHLWLVDPLDGEQAFAAGNANFSINIALIEDGRPIYGVVHAPAIDTTYYARAGKGAYRRVGGEEPVRLGTGGDSDRRSGISAAVPERNFATEHDANASSYALAMCALASGGSGRETVLRPSMEWHTAAGHAILNSGGVQVRDCESGQVLSYNKKTLENDRVKVVRGTPHGP